jgi:hypothetical protein
MGVQEIPHGSTDKIYKQILKGENPKPRDTKQCAVGDALRPDVGLLEDGYQDQGDSDQEAGAADEGEQTEGEDPPFDLETALDAMIEEEGQGLPEVGEPCGDAVVPNPAPVPLAAPPLPPPAPEALSPGGSHKSKVEVIGACVNNLWQCFQGR